MCNGYTYLDTTDLASFYLPFFLDALQRLIFFLWSQLMELLRLSKIIRIVKRNSFHDLNVIPSPYTAGPPLSCASPPGRVAPKNIATGETSQVITSRHFSSLLFTSMSILTSLALINWKANTIHIHISNNSTFPFISLHFILSLLLSIERQKQYKYINKAIQKAQLSSYILVTHTEIFLDTLKPRLYKKFYQIL